MPRAKPRQRNARRAAQARPTAGPASPATDVVPSTVPDSASSNDAPRPLVFREGSCACCGEIDQNLIKACCCEGRLVHAECWKQQHFESWKKYRSESKHMPVTELLDCPHCGSAYRFKYQSRFLRMAVENFPSALWPILFIMFYALAFLMLCQIHTFLGDYSPKGIFFVPPGSPYEYFWGGIVMINVLTMVIRVKGRGSLMYLAMFSRDSGDSTNTLYSIIGKLIFGAVVVYNMYTVTREIYMYGIWITIKLVSPLSFIENAPIVTASSNYSQDVQDETESIPDVETFEIFDDDDTTPLTGDRLSEVAQNPVDNSVASSSSLPESSVLLQKEHPQVFEEPAREDSARDEPPAASPAFKAHSECICCFEKSARFVAGNCGHLVACGQCRKRLVYRELCQLGVAGLPKMRDLGIEMVSDTMITCPVCRIRGVLVALQHFKGTVFHP